MPIKERPILFSEDMVRAILDGRKTVTRRVMDEQPSFDATGRWGYTVDSTDRKFKDTWNYSVMDRGGHKFTERGRESEVCRLRCPYGQSGDRLWVRETWAAGKCADGLRPKELHAGTWLKDNGGLWYRANSAEPKSPISERGKWRPGRFMVRWTSQITLKVMSIRVERLQDITEDRAKAEGFPLQTHTDEMNAFLATVGGQLKRSLAEISFGFTWDALNASRGFGWDKNPWVWVVEFRRVLNGN